MLIGNKLRASILRSIDKVLDDEEMGENDDIAVIKREPLTQSNEAISSDEEASLDSREGIVPFCSLFAYFSGLHCVG